MKKYIIAAAVWTQTGTVEETPARLQVAVVSVPEPTVEDIEAEIKTTPPTEEEKVELPQAEPLHEDTPKPEPTIDEIPEISEAQPTTESEPEPVPVPDPAPASAPSQTAGDPQPSDMIYVPGFGWLESQGPGEAIYAVDMYENGNKVGSMG